MNIIRCRDCGNCYTNEIDRCNECGGNQLDTIRLPYETGQRVKFKKEYYAHKRDLARDGGLFGGPVDFAPNDSFEITGVNNQGDGIELRLAGYPWLVYDDEVEPV